ncbi:MAG: NADH-quinone oxidoreductase subunit C [Candidatus Schekmanbacteria bacterium]|nr:NADH-quinone oxidoreductase subunit C [Candidatus Schekmanbacteria bacterium]
MSEIKNMQSLIDSVKKNSPQAVLAVTKAKDIDIITVKKEFLLEIARFLHDDTHLDLKYLSFLTAVDYPRKDQRFEVLYQLYSLKNNHKLRMCVPVPEDDPQMDSVTGIWAAAVLLEMEVFDMFGIKFNNHPDMRRIFMPDDWEGHPLRKDYPLQGDRQYKVDLDA